MEAQNSQENLSLDKAARFNVMIENRDYHKKPKIAENERPEYIRIPVSAIWFKGIECSVDGASSTLLKEVVSQIEEKAKEMVSILVDADSIIK